MPVQNQKMEHRTISVPEKQVKEMEIKVTSGEYPNFSEAVRSAMREFLERHPNNSAAAFPAPQEAQS